MHISISSIFVSLEKTGGLFDIDATLPVLLIQFFILVQILSLVLFQPIQKILKRRQNEIETNLRNAQLRIEGANQLQENAKKIFRLVRRRHVIRSKEIEGKTKAILLEVKKDFDTELRENREIMIMTYKKKATSLAPQFISALVSKINDKLKYRPALILQKK